MMMTLNYLSLPGKSPRRSFSTIGLTIAGR